MLASKDTVRKLIPQEQPMIMVDSLISCNEQHTLTGFRIERDNIFVSNGYLTEAGIIENMAQSAALRTGWMSMQKAKDKGDFKPSVGVIGSVKNFKLYRQPATHTNVQTEIEVMAEVFNASIIEARVMAGKELLASCELKIFTEDLSN